MDKRFGSVVVVALLLVAMVVAISGCTSPSTGNATATPTVTTTPTAGNYTIVTMEAGEPESLDPAYDYESSGGEILQNVYETLLFYNGSSSSDLKGVLAKSYTVSPDGLNYTFYLRDNVYFQDGTKFNASAVKYTFDRGVIMNLDPWVTDMSPMLLGGNEYMASNQTAADIQKYLSYKAVEVINETTVVMHLAQPYAAWPYVMAFQDTSIISPTYDQANGGYTPNNQSQFMTEHMCGTGPYSLGEWAHKDHITLVRNDNYWGTKANSAKVIIKYADDYNTRLLALKSGEADLMVGDIGIHYNDLKNDTSIVINENPSTMTIDFIGMNQKYAPFDNLLVRKAFAESFDYNTYIEKVLNGFGKKLNGPIPEGLPGYNSTRPYIQYNTTDAKALLAQAGYNSSNPLNVTLYYNAGNSARQTACLLLKQSIESYDPSYSVNVQELDWPTFLQKQRAKELPIFFLGWIADYPSADNFVGPFYWSQSYFAPRVKFSNSTIDSLYTAAIAEQDQAKQLAMYDQIIDIGNSQYPYIYEVQPENLIAHSPNLKGIVYNPTYSQFVYAGMYK
jgi:peptide/nickel transport system substrate-binding protein